MGKRKIIKGMVAMAVLLVIVGILKFYEVPKKPIILCLVAESDVQTNDFYQVFYTTETEGEEAQFREEQSIRIQVCAGTENELIFSLPYDLKKIRLDFGSNTGTIDIRSMTFHYGRIDLTPDQDALSNMQDISGISSVSFANGGVHVESISEDPFMAWDTSGFEIAQKAEREIVFQETVRKAAICMAVIFVLLLFLWKSEYFLDIAAEMYENRNLVLRLSVNDFKTKYAGSYLGILWAFVQPVVTVLVYWFVFEKGLKAGSSGDVPFVLWLIAGLVPWFFFSDSWNGATNSLVEYHYLVKKVVFQVDMLPFMKILSSLYVHACFLAFMLLLYACYGYLPDVYTLQIAYYMTCTIILAAGIGFASAAIVAFFRDLNQIISIILQVGIWMTPIMWDIDGMGLSETMVSIFKCNPMYYIVSGYRDALIHKVWFFEDIGQTVYFWVFSLIMLGGGLLLFRRLKVHFADVL